MRGAERRRTDALRARHVGHPDDAARSSRRCRSGGGVRRRRRQRVFSRARRARPTASFRKLVARRRCSRSPASRTTPTSTIRARKTRSTSRCGRAGRARPTSRAGTVPWGRGRPGWHIECSALCHQYLGPQMTHPRRRGRPGLPAPRERDRPERDGHAACARSPQIWSHVAMVRMDGEKMSKSLGNMVFVRDLLADVLGRRDSAVPARTPLSPGVGMVAGRHGGRRARRALGVGRCARARHVRRRDGARRLRRRPRGRPGHAARARCPADGQRPDAARAGERPGPDVPRPGRHLRNVGTLRCDSTGRRSAIVRDTRACVSPSTTFGLRQSLHERRMDRPASRITPSRGSAGGAMRRPSRSASLATLSVADAAARRIVVGAAICSVGPALLLDTPQPAPRSQRRDRRHQRRRADGPLPGGLNLYQQGWASTWSFRAPRTTTAPATPTSCATWPSQRGVPDAAILEEPQGEDTWGNAVYTRQVLERTGCTARSW